MEKRGNKAWPYVDLEVSILITGSFKALWPLESYEIDNTRELLHKLCKFVKFWAQSFTYTKYNTKWVLLLLLLYCYLFKESDGSN